MVEGMGDWGVEGRVGGWAMAMGLGAGALVVGVGGALRVLWAMITCLDDLLGDGESWDSGSRLV